MRLLLIEDEAKLASYLRQGLSEEGFVVETASNGVDGLHMATQGHYDLIVLDGMLPGIDGLGVLAALRHSRDTPVLMLTARGTVEDRVKGLQSGADDYLTKPFAFSELVARLHVLMRRGKTGGASEPTVLRLHDLELDLLKRRATRAGKRSSQRTEPKTSSRDEKSGRYCLRTRASTPLIVDAPRTHGNAAACRVTPA